MHTHFGAVRMALGLAFLCLPKHVAAACRIPYIPEAAIAGRMTGARDFAIGLLLYNCRPRLTNPKRIEPRENATLCNNAYSGARLSWNDTQRALISGMIVDGIDVLSVLWCYLEGNLPTVGIRTVGGPAVVFLGLGVFLWYSELKKNM